MHHKRKKPRARTRSKTHDLNNWPAWWDVIFHRRKPRRKEHALLHHLKSGEDPDTVVFDPPHKPHHYYW